MTTSLIPDVLNHSWSDYNVHVGMWRMMEVMEKHGIKGTVALNSDVCRHYSRIIEGGKHLVWEWMCHGNNNSTLINRQAEDEERQLIKDVVDTIKAGTGQQPRGWLSPANLTARSTSWHRTGSNMSATGSPTSSPTLCV